jgi:hypothetical protein
MDGTQLESDRDGLSHAKRDLRVPESCNRGLSPGVVSRAAQVGDCPMIDIEVPCSGMWEFAADKASHVFYPDRTLVDPPLTGVERRAFAQEIGNRRERWRDASEMHLLDLYRAHPRGWR